MQSDKTMPRDPSDVLDEADFALAEELGFIQPAGEKLTVREIVGEFLTSERGADALACNTAAFDLAEIWLRRRMETAALEAGRKDFQLTLRDEFAAAGENKTRSDELARTDARYLEYLDRLQESQMERDRAEVGYKVLYQRAYLLAGRRDAEMGE